MSRKFYGIFVAGGSGTRMGSDTPKQFLPLMGKPILQVTIERFLEAVPDMKVIVVLPKAHFQTWKELCATHAFDCPQVLVAGGITRFQSVRNALAKIPDGVLVSVHDGVRPFVSPALVAGMREMMATNRALIPVVPVVDTLISTEEGLPDPDRSKMAAVQTPQMFLSEDIRRAYAQPYDVSFTDDASVVRRAGIHVSTTKGERLNIKITTPEDLALGEAILTLKQP